MNAPRSCLAVVAACVLCQLPAFAAPFSFVEPFTSPPITAGTSPSPVGDWEDGFVSGDNGWTVLETTGISGQGTNFGQRDAPAAESPGGAFSGVANVRMRSGLNAFLVRNLGATPLASGNVSLTVSDQLSFFALGTSSMQLQLATDGGATVGTRITFGDLTTPNRFEAVDGNATVIASTTTQTVDSRNLLWQNSLDVDPNNGDYITLSVDFDVVTDTASVVITTVDAAGSASSTSPVVVGFENNIDEVSWVVLIAHPPANGQASVGSLVWMDSFSITGTTIPDSPGVTDIRAETDGSITIEWESVSNRTYDVEKNAAITNGFNPVATVTGAAPTATYNDTNTVGIQGNYRVNLLP